MLLLLRSVVSAISGLEIGPVRDDQQSGKYEFSFNEFVLLNECPCLTLIRKDK